MNLPRRIFQSRFFNPVRFILDPESEKLRSFVQSAADAIRRGAIVVDVGAGECQYKKFFLDKRYVSVDFGGGDQDWDYTQIDVIADIHKLPIKDEMADAVLCTEVLEHAYNPQEVVCEIARILKYEGKAFFTVPQGWGEHQIPHDYFRYTQFGMQVLLSRAGLTAIEIIKTTGLFGYLANRLTMVPKVLFWSTKSRVYRALLLPAELLSYFLFVICPAVFIAPLDVLDRNKIYTLHYTVIACKNKFDPPENEKK